MNYDERYNVNLIKTKPHRADEGREERIYIAVRRHLVSIFMYRWLQKVSTVPQKFVL